MCILHLLSSQQCSPVKVTEVYYGLKTLAKAMFKKFFISLVDTLSKYLKQHQILSCKQEGLQALKRAQRPKSARCINLRFLQGLQRSFIGVHIDFYDAYPST